MNLRRGRPGCFWTRTGPAVSPGQHGSRSAIVDLLPSITRKRSREKRPNKAAVLWPRSVGLGFLLAHYLVTLVGGERNEVEVEAKVEVGVSWSIDSSSIAGLVEACKSSVDGMVEWLLSGACQSSAPVQPGGAGSPRFEARRSFGASFPFLPFFASSVLRPEWLCDDPLQLYVCTDHYLQKRTFPARARLIGEGSGENWSVPTMAMKSCDVIQLGAAASLHRISIRSLPASGWG